MQTQWKSGDQVFLSRGTSKKGCGIIQCVDPQEKCGCDYIGHGCVSVHVTQSIEDSWPLPFPTIEAKNMSSAVGSIIKWPIQLLMQSKEGFHDHAEYVEDLQNASLMRDARRKKRVYLWNETKTQKLGEGVILLVYPHETINFTELGESHLGVILENPLHSTRDASFFQNDLPHLSLIPWPINQLTFENGESLKSTDIDVDTCINDEELHNGLSLQEIFDSENEITSSDDELQNAITQGICSQKRKYVRRVRSAKTNQDPATLKGALSMMYKRLQ